MQKVDLSNLIWGISTWDELESRIANLSTEQDRGDAFEQFCHAFFVLDPVFQFDKVYRQSEIPPSLLERLGYPARQDIGIDGIAVTTEDKLFAYQAKFRRDRSNTPTLRELSTFFTMSDRADWRITITNASKLPHRIDDRTRQSRVLVDRLERLDQDFFNRLRQYLKEQSVIPPEIKTPNETQQEAIDEALSYFKENSRGQLILPCGTGKTLTSLWIAEKLESRNILVLVPSLSLMSQTLREWASNTSLNPFRYMCLCSDTTVDLGNDSPVEHLYEMDVPVTTDVDTVTDYLQKDTSATSILFSTYQSSKVLLEATKKAGITFDIAIFDEAHRTTGTKVGVWSTALDDNEIPIKYRLFMTATPRIYTPHITKKAKEEDVLICSMDDATVYGKPFYELTFGEAIARGHITDYKIVVICVTDSEARELIQRGDRIITDDEHEWDAEALAKRVALVKGLNAYGLKKIFTFHSKVKGAKEFTDSKTQYGINRVYEMLSQENNHREIKAFHVNGTMSSGLRNGLLREFEQAEMSIISNARCLTEGVDIPNVDTIAFIDPKKSIIDIVQATGRAMRKAEWKEKGYIFIPVIVDEDTDPEQFIEESNFKTVWQVLQAILDQDQRLEGIVSQLRVMQGKGDEGTKAWRDTMSESSEKIEFYNLPSKINQEQFINTLYTKAIEVVGKKWDFWYGLTLKYKEQTGAPNASAGYKTAEGFNLRSWQMTQRQSYKKGILSADRIKRLEEIGFIWDQLDSAFERGFRETIFYKEQTGDSNASVHYKTADGFNLGIWQLARRSAYKKGILSADRIKRLEEIGFIWDQLEELFNVGFQETVRYKEQTGAPNASAGYKTAEGFNLRSWQQDQRHYYKKGTLSADRIKRLEEIGFVWNQLEEAFEQGYKETLRYKEQTGDPNASGHYKTAEGFNLGKWQSHRRLNYNKGTLTADRIKRLEDIGFIWDQLEEAFEQGYKETLRYKEQTGDPNTPQRYKTAEGFNLGMWQGSKRTYYKKGTLSADRIKRLEDIGFIWDQLEKAFEESFQETVRYKEQTGDPNATFSFKTAEGFPLGTWQSHQRAYYKKGKLSADRIKRLEDIGFIWNQLEEAFEQGYKETLRYKEQTGNSNALRRYKTPSGFNLGTWQSDLRKHYKKATLSADKIKRLEEIGFIWDQREESFEEGYRETILYKDKTGNPNVSQNFKTAEGFNLGIWQNTQRGLYKKGILSADIVKRLEEIGFIWDKLEEAFKKGFTETLIYKEQTGMANAPSNYKTAEGFNLGMWQNNKRTYYKKGTLSAERIKRLEEVGFKWTRKKK